MPYDSYRALDPGLPEEVEDVKGFLVQIFHWDYTRRMVFGSFRKSGAPI